MISLGDDFLISIAEEFYNFPAHNWIDQYCAVQKYLFQGQSELDCLVDRVHIGEEKSKEVLKFRSKKVAFTR
jgi:hypothetical protein